jgi:3-mercaptopyruvate sulfurtransferase SseA
VALLLQRRGITRVHPLEGGIARWIALGFPVRELTPPAIPAVESAPSSGEGMPA